MFDEAKTSGLINEFIKAGIVALPDEFGQLHITQDVFYVRIASRNWYCDRGSWLVHAESTDPTVATVDAADMFPRYYFHDSCLVKEVATWFDIRIKNRQQ